MKIDWNDPIGCIEGRMFKIKEEHGIWPEVLTFAEERHWKLLGHEQIARRLCAIRGDVWHRHSVTFPPPSVTATAIRHMKHGGTTAPQARRLPIRSTASKTPRNGW